MTLVSTEPFQKSIAFQSGQPVRIWDEGDIVFDGVITRVVYYIKDDMQMVDIILGTYLFQLTRQPLIFDTNMASLLAKSLNIDINQLLAGNVTQQTTIYNLLLAGILPNTDFVVYSNGSPLIDSSVSGSPVFVMANANESKDSIFRQSINYLNCVFYQSEDGNIIVGPLNISSNPCSFNIDVTNALATGYLSNIDDINYLGYGDVAAVVDLRFIDNVYTTPVISTNYGFVNANTSISESVQSYYTVSTINQSSFPRVGQLLNGKSWFIGDTSQATINQNIVNDPNVTSAYKSSYINKNPSISTVSSSVDNFSNYQTMLTSQDMAIRLKDMYVTIATVLLDDPVFQDAVGNSLPTGTLLGKTITIHNGLVDSGVIVTTCRAYNSDGVGTLSMNISPIGSIAGSWNQ